MAWLKDAIRKEVTRHRTLMEQYDGTCYHIAVSNGASLFNYFNQPGNPTSHFYVRKAGPLGPNAGMADYEQYVDTQYRAPANLEGNYRLISAESQGGVGDDLQAGWTVAQVNRLAWIAAECHRLHGIPLQIMPDSRPTSRGLGYHRLGIDPWRVPDGERWSKSYGKECPGYARIRQMDTIATRARILSAGGDDGAMAWTDAQIAQHLNNQGQLLDLMTKIQRDQYLTAVRLDSLVNKQFPDLRQTASEIAADADREADKVAGPDAT